MPGPRDIVPFPPGCPWSGWAPPDIRHCEDNLCAWIAAPSDTWSNAAYFIAAAVLWRLARGERGAARLFPAAALVIGLTSFAFHASFTAAFQFLDYLGMFLLAALMLAVDFERLAWTKSSSALMVVAGLTIASAGAFWASRALGLPVQPIMAVEALLIVALEARLALRTTADYRYLWLALGLLAAALGFWLGDYTRVLCDPRNHLLQAHAVWHLLTAAALVAAFRFYRQFAASPYRPPGAPPTHALF